MFSETRPTGSKIQKLIFHYFNIRNFEIPKYRSFQMLTPIQNLKYIHRTTAPIKSKFIAIPLNIVNCIGELIGKKMSSKCVECRKFPLGTLWWHMRKSRRCLVCLVFGSYLLTYLMVVEKRSSHIVGIDVS